MSTHRAGDRGRLLTAAQRRLGIVALVGCLAVLGAGCDWTQAGYGPGQAYFNPTETTLTASTVGSLDEAFTVTLPVGTSAPPIVVGGSLVVTSRDASTSTASVTAYDGSTGSVRWSTPLPGAIVQVSQPVSISGRIYATTRDTTGAFQLVALARSSGAVLATTPLASFAGGVFDAPSLGQVAASDGRLIVVTNQAYGAIPSWSQSTIRVIDPDTGATRWAHTVFTGTGAAVVGSEGGQVTVSYGSNPRPGMPAGSPATITWDVATGTTLWSHDSATDFTVIQPSMGSRGEVFAAVQDPSSGIPGVQAIDATTGELAWSAPAVTPLAATADRIIVADFLGGMSALDASSGTSKWSITGAGWQPTIAGSVLYAVDSSTASPVLKTYSVDSGSFIAPVPVAIGGRPIVTDGHVYLSNGTTLYAYAPA